MRDHIIPTSYNAYSHADNFKLLADDGFVVRAFGFFFCHEKVESFFEGGDEVCGAVSFGTFVVLVREVFGEICYSGFLFGEIYFEAGKSSFYTIVIVILVRIFSFVGRFVDFGEVLGS